MDDAFHFDVHKSSSHGYIEAMQVKGGHTFDVGQLTLSVNPIVCQTGRRNYLTQIGQKSLME